MKVFTCHNFKGHHPVGTAAVVVAGNAEDAATILTGHLYAIGLPQIIDPKQMDEVAMTGLYVRVLCDGDY